MEVQIQTGQAANSDQHPGKDGREKKKTEQTQPNRSRLVEQAQQRAGITKRQQRSGEKADRQNAEAPFEPKRAAGSSSRRRQSPRLIEQIMRQKKHRLNHRNETN